ncbi:hypothetical protein [Microbacterium maritypicum]|uniref:hypothetical protein n=1 Tax=Microbacterium maritypicum TaxID=33918 RepID=UPI003A905A92
MTEAARPTCFIAMPITVHDDEAELYRDPEHWAHVMRHLFIPAIEAAGYTAIEPSANGTSMIHGRIINHLATADLVLCDLSQHNPNVLFELGVRTSLNKPVALVKDEHLKLPFDIQGLNTHPYSSKLHAWELPGEIDALTAHIHSTREESAGTNPLWRHFGVAITAETPSVDVSPVDARLELLLERLEGVESAVRGPSWYTRTLNPSMSAAAMVSTILGVENVSEQPMDGFINLRAQTITSSLDVQQSRADAILSALQTAGYEPRLDTFSSTDIDLRVIGPRLDAGRTLSLRRKP